MIVAGFGCRASATPAALAAAFAATASPHPDALAIPTHRAHLLAHLARTLAIPIVALRPEALATIITPTQSPASLAAHRTGSVAEAVALVAAGPGARILIPRHIDPDRLATCAIARSESLA